MISRPKYLGIMIMTYFHIVGVRVPNRWSKYLERILGKNHVNIFMIESTLFLDL